VGLAMPWSCPRPIQYPCKLDISLDWDWECRRSDGSMNGGKRPIRETLPLISSVQSWTVVREDCCRFCFFSTLHGGRYLLQCAGISRVDHY
jgi:hypothetical protein